MGRVTSENSSQGDISVGKNETEWSIQKATATGRDQRGDYPPKTEKGWRCMYRGTERRLGSLETTEEGKDSRS